MIYGHGIYKVTANKFETRSNFNTSTSPNQGGYSASANAITGNYTQDLLEGIISSTDVTNMSKIYKDMYLHDIVCGSAVDLYSNLPFSPFTLSGVGNEKILQKFMDCVERMKIKRLLPGISVDYQVMGTFIGNMNWDPEQNIFESITPYSLANCTLIEVPIFGVDPIIDVKIDPNMVKFISNKNDPRFSAIISRIPPAIQQAIKKGVIQLQPRNTLYIPRGSFSSSGIGESLYRRILPIYIMEKALIRGTMDQVYRRQRGIMHLSAGDESWEPTDNELQNIVNLFSAADLDPVNAVVATRNGININDVKRGDDFFKWTDVQDTFSSIKLKGLGINASFLEGDASYATLETSMSVFVENLRAFRNTITREVFYDKLFPTISFTNGFTRSKSNRVYSQELRDVYNIHGSKILKDNKGQFIALCQDGSSDVPEIEDISDYEIPTVNWLKRLQPEADDQYLQILSSLKDQGIPIPLRLFAAAGGLDIDEISRQLEEDVKIREVIAEYNKDISALAPKDTQGEFSSLIKQNPDSGAVPRRPLFGRNLEHEAFIPKMEDGKGKLRVPSLKTQRLLEDRIMKNGAAALANMARKENYETKATYTPKTYVTKRARQ